MLKHNLLIESGSIGTDMVGNRLVGRLADKNANRLPEIVRLTITLFECPWFRSTKLWRVSTVSDTMSRNDLVLSHSVLSSLQEGVSVRPSVKHQLNFQVRGQIARMHLMSELCLTC